MIEEEKVDVTAEEANVAEDSKEVEKEAEDLKEEREAKEVVREEENSDLVTVALEMVVKDQKEFAKQT
jgi:hypothetical protein